MTGSTRPPCCLKSFGQNLLRGATACGRRSPAPRSRRGTEAIAPHSSARPCWLRRADPQHRNVAAARQAQQLADLRLPSARRPPDRPCAPRPRRPLPAGRPFPIAARRRVSGCTSSTTTSASSRTAVSPWPAPTVSSKITSKPNSASSADHHVEVLGHGLVTAGRRQAANEQARVFGPAGHPHPIAQQRAAGQRALRIAGQHGHGLAVAAQQLGQLAHQRAFAHAGVAGDGHDQRMLVLLGQRWRRGSRRAVRRGQPASAAAPAPGDRARRTAKATRQACVRLPPRGGTRRSRAGACRARRRGPRPARAAWARRSRE